MKKINCKKLKEIIKNSNILLFDVREPFEHKIENLGGQNIPASEIQNRFSEIPKDNKAIIYCRSGSRSSMIINFLEKDFGYQNLINLDGGIINCH